jgi:hypothetical protein
MIGLEDFITQTLTQIVRGVVAAQAAAREHGAVIAPSGLTISGTNTALTRYCERTLDVPQDVHFDLAVTTTE